MKGIKRSIRYWSWVSGKNMLILIVFAVFFGVMFGMLDGGIAETLNVTGFYLILFGIVCGGAMQVSAMQAYLGQCIAMNAKRRDVFIGMQYANIFPAICMYLCALVFQAVAGMTGAMTGMSGWQLNTWSGQTLFFYVAGVLFVNGCGNLVSILSARFGKIGMVAFVILMAVCGGIMGGMSSVITDGQISFFPNVPRVLIFGIPAALYIVTAVFQYRSVRKYEIHV